MNGGIKIGRWTLTKQPPHIVTVTVFLILKCHTSYTNKRIYTNTVYSEVHVLAPSLSLAVMQYQLISYTITLQRRGEQSSYIKANSYMKGLSHSNKHCMWSCNCGGCRVAWEWLTIHYHTLDSHSSKVQHILDDCPLPCTAVVDAYADEACSQLSSLAVCMTAAWEALVKLPLCTLHTSMHHDLVAQ